MVLMYEGQNYQRRATLMRTASSTLELGYGNHERNGTIAQEYSDGLTGDGIPSFPRRKKGHKRSSSDVTQIFKSQTLPHGFVPAYHRTNSSGSTKKSTSFFAGIANKVKSALEGKQEVANNKNVSWALRADEFGTASSDSSPIATRRAKHVTNNGKVKRVNGVSPSKKSPNKLTVPSDRQWAGSRHCSLPNDYSNDSNMFYPSFEPVWGSGSDEPEKISTARHNSSPNVDERLVNRRFSIASNDTATSTASSDNSNKSGDVNILVMGAEGVGKSALIVRYLTKRFIGEYAPNFESVYDQTVNIEGKEVNLHVWDSEIPVILQKPSEKSSKPDTDPEDSQSPRLREALSITSLTSSVASSISSSSSTHGCRFSNGSMEEEHQFAKTFGPAILVDSASTPADKASARQSESQNAAKQARGKSEINNNSTSADEMQLRLNWCDGMVVVYSICDAESFEAARDVIRFVRGQYVRGHAVSDFNHSAPDNRGYSISGESPSSDPQNRYSRLPILLIGNKSDLEHRRKVDLRALHAFAAAYGCTAAEISVSDGFEPVSRVFKDLVEKVRKDKLPSRLTKIKSIVKTVSGTFGHRRNMSM